MGVPEVVKPDSRKTCSASNPTELLGNRGWSPGRAVRVTKHEVSLGRWDTQYLYVPFLARSMLFQ